jgi:hypothetical protein
MVLTMVYNTQNFWFFTFVNRPVLCYKPKVAGSVPDDVIGFFN